MTSFFNQTGITNSISGSAQTAATNAETSKDAAAASATAAAASASAAAASATAANANATNVTTVAGIASDVTAVAGVSTNVSTLAQSSNVSNMNTLSPIASDITSAAGKATEIGRLGTTAAIADMAALGTTAVINDMDALADITANISTVASNLSSVNSFANTYRVGASDPTTSLDVGDIFFNTTSSALKIYSGAGGWQQGVTLGSGFLPLTGGSLSGNLQINDANLIFEGSTADTNETTVTATDPTADRTITLPDKTGTVVTVASDGSTGQLLKTDGSGNYSFVTVATNLSGDSSPTLSGNLDVGTSDIVSSSNNNISLLPNGTGKVIVDGNGSTGGISVTDGLMEMRSGTSSPAQIDLYCEVSNAHKVSIKAPAHANYSGNVNFTLPSGNGSNGQVLTTDGSGNLSYSTVDLTALSAANLTSGTLPDARFPATLPAASGVNLTALNASNLASGTIPDARFPATLPAVSGANLTGISSDVVGDTTPQLGGNLDTNGNAILFGSSKWSIELDAGDNDLLFKYNGTTVFKLASSGAVTSANDITAFGSP